MKHSQEWVDKLINSSHIGILIVDKERNNLFVNDRICEMFGYDKEELLRTNAKIFHVNHETFLNFADLAFDAVLKGKPLGVDYQFKKKDGTLFWIHIAGDPVGAKEEVLWSMVDITPRVEAQEKELVLKQQLEEALAQKEKEIATATQLVLKNKKLLSMIEQTHDSIIVTDLQGKISTWNHGSEHLFGYTAQEAVGQSVLILEPSNRDIDFTKAISGLMQDGEFHVDKEVQKKDKTTISISLSLTILYDEENNPTGMVGFAQDITARKKAEKELQETNYNMQRYLEAIDKIGIGLFVVDEDFGVRYMNETLKGWFGDQTGKTCYASVAGLQEPCPYCKLHDVIYDNKKVNYEPTTANGETFEIVATSIKNADGTTSKMEFIRNITDQKLAQINLEREKEKFDYQAHHDALTDLPNRLLFHDRLTQAIEKAKRNDTKVALLFIDLDHFKEINDSLGHDIGDEILKTVTSRLKEALREEDTLARLGGDEFTVIVDDIKEPQDSSIVASKMLSALSQKIVIGENTLYVSSSIGISIYPNDGLSAQNLLKYADSAMYKAKEEGRNNYQYYDSSMTEVAFERVVMEASLRDALKKEEFLVYYQPQVDASNDNITGMEALVRWQHPTMGIVSPAKFIPLAEATGLIVDLDRYVMKTAMSQLSAWYKKGLNPGILAMNLAVKQLEQNDFIPMFKKLILETECKPEWLALEVTEGQIMTHPDQAITLLQKISDLGIELAVDDFGTGYSSLAYLKRLPIDKLKIDQTFVRDLPDDEEDAGITKAVIALAKSLNLKIIAEGVETQEQKEFLLQNGCESIQGYFYSRPVSAKEFEVLLDS